MLSKECKGISEEGRAASGGSQLRNRALEKVALGSPAVGSGLVEGLLTSSKNRYATEEEGLKGSIEQS